MAYFVIKKDIEMDLEQFIKDNLNEISNHDVFLSVGSGNYFKNPKCLVQISIAIVLDMPIFMLIQEGIKVPKKLIRVLDGYAFYERDNKVSFKEEGKKMLIKIDKFMDEREGA